MDTHTVHLIANVLHQSEALDMHVSLYSTLETKIVYPSEAPGVHNDIHSTTNDKYSTQ